MHCRSKSVVISLTLKQNVNNFILKNDLFICTPKDIFTKIVKLNVYATSQIPD